MSDDWYCVGGGGGSGEGAVVEAPRGSLKAIAEVTAQSDARPQADGLQPLWQLPQKRFPRGPVRELL